MSSKKRYYWNTLILLGFLALLSVIPMRLAIASVLAPTPQAIFVLGGDSNRMEFAARFWQSHPHLDIWVSDDLFSLEADRQIFLRFGVPRERLHLDGRATDTVTNFTTLAADFATYNIQNLYLITSDYHMRRSRAIAAIVLGSRGVVVTPLPVPSGSEVSESWVRVLRDCGRSLLWLITGRTGASLNPHLQS
jgi:uncharacterized SAM-binding protein YcdF (DUF218 family)